jgi:hypothetical protein
LDTYVKSRITPNTSNITSQEKTVIDGEEAIKVYHLGVGDYEGLKYIESKRLIALDLVDS